MTFYKTYKVTQMYIKILPYLPNPLRNFSSVNSHLVNILHEKYLKPNGQLFKTKTHYTEIMYLVGDSVYSLASNLASAQKKKKITSFLPQFGNSNIPK